MLALKIENLNLVASQCALIRIKRNCFEEILGSFLAILGRFLAKSGEIWLIFPGKLDEFQICSNFKVARVEILLLLRRT